MWECSTNSGREQQCREYSAVGEFSTASMPPRFASFVVGGVVQVRCRVLLVQSIGFDMMHNTETGYSSDKKDQGFHAELPGQQNWGRPQDCKGGCS